jgi:hypothetical protein
MKKVTLLVFMLSILSYSFSQIVIPNNSFETWESNPFPVYEEPTPWGTPNPYTSLAGAVTVTKSDDAVSGNYSARLETIEIQLGSSTLQAPGLVTYADFNVNIATGDYSFSGGLFMQKRISSLSGKFKYQSAENDSASVLIYCYKHPEGENIDTIGVGLAFLHDAETWTDFTVNMNYFNTQIPDTFNVLIMSTGTFELGYMPPGSVLYVDDITVDTAANAIESNQSLQAKLYPNPTSGLLIIEVDDVVKDGNLKIFDLSGHLVSERVVNGQTIKTDVTRFANGPYTFTLTGLNKRPITGTFIKQ